MHADENFCIVKQRRWCHDALVALDFFFLVGLTYSEAVKLDNYLHFSTPKNRKKKSLLEIGDLNPAIDFLDDISEDIPKSETIFTSIEVLILWAEKSTSTYTHTRGCISVFLAW